MSSDAVNSMRTMRAMRTMRSGSSGPDRFVTIWCPDWPVVAAGCPADRPAAVLAAHRVVARTPAAAVDGVVIGQRRRQAQASCPGVQLVEHDPARDAREFEQVVRAVIEVAPRLDVVEPGWISLAARGPSRYFGGDAAVASHLRSLVGEQVGETPVGVGVADGRFAASVAARLAVRHREPVVVDPGASPAFCSPLSVGWLQALGEVDAELVDLFVRLGLRRLGDLADLPPADVLARFGHPGVHAHRLAAGADERPASTEDPPVEMRLARVFDDPVAHADAVVFVAKQLADDLAARLAADGRVCTRLVVQLETEHGERSERSWYRSSGISASAMVERVRWQLDAWIRQPRGSGDEITAGVALVRLVPDEVQPDVGVQLGLWGGRSDADHRAGRAIARLTTLTSERAVTVPVWQGGRLPSERYRWTPAATVDLDARGAVPVSTGAVASSSGSPPTTDPASPAAPWPGSLPPPSPATVYDPLIPVDVVDAAGDPVRVSGRGVVSSPPATLRWAGSPAAEITAETVAAETVAAEVTAETVARSSPVVRRVRAWAGPWPVDQRWWEPARHRRLARFQIVLEPAGTSSVADDREPGRDDQQDDQQVVLVFAEHRRWWLAARYD